MIKLDRKKKFNFTTSLIYKTLKKLPLSKKTKFKFFSNISWIFNQLAYETSYEIIKVVDHPAKNGFINFINIKWIYLFFFLFGINLITRPSHIIKWCNHLLFSF